MADSITETTLDGLFSSMPTGSLDRAILNNLRGINHRQIPGMLPSNNDSSGMIFFTRPQLNMQKDNLRNTRWLSQLLSNVSTSMQTYIRCMLDPRLMTGLSYQNSSIPPINCPIIDNKQAFITVLTNNYLSNSGWPSISVPTFSSKAGLYNESYSMVDGRVLNSEAWDLNVNFRNTRGDPILFLFYVWGLYMSFVFENKLVPYPDFITENEIDYNTRIYRLTMDYKKTKVTKIAACHAAFPVGIPVGDSFNSESTDVQTQGNKEINMSFRCMGVDYFDPITVNDFNRVVEIFNPEMADGLRESRLIKLSSKAVLFGNHNGYPRINTENMELEWWVDIETFRRIAGSALDSITEASSDDETGD